MIKRFGILGMGMFGILASGMIYMEEAGDGGAGAAGVEAAPAAATVKVDGKEPAPAVTEQKPQPGDAEVLDKAGYAPVDNDPGLNYAMRFLAGNGFDAANPAVEAAFGGDFSLLKAELSAKGIQGWEQALGLAEQSYDRHVKEGEASAAKVGEIVTGVATARGVDWEAAVAHVGKTANADERTAINTLLGNPATAHIAAQFITGAFMESGDGEYAPAARAVGDATKTHQGQGGQLSRREYTAELSKLRESIGDSYMSSPQAAALFRRLG